MMLYLNITDDNYLFAFILLKIIKFSVAFIYNVLRIYAGEIFRMQKLIQMP